MVHANIGYKVGNGVGKMQQMICDSETKGYLSSGCLPSSLIYQSIIKQRIKCCLQILV